MFKRFPRISDYENSIKAGVKICRNCDRPVAKYRRNYCSENCMEEFNRNHDWFFVRQDVLRRDNFRCSICLQRKKKTELDVDHTIPVQMGIDPFDKGNLRLLCKDCHKAKTKLDKEAIQTVRHS